MVKSWPTHGDAPQVTYGPIADACEQVFEFDAHFCAYSSPTTPYRLGGAGALDVEPKMVLLVLDVDGPNHKCTPEWWALEEVKVRALFADVGRGYCYTTRGGYRIIFGLADPLPLRTREDARRWTASYEDWCTAIAAEHKIICDQSCSDWTRLFRLPRVRREGDDVSREPVAEIGRVTSMLEWRLPYVAADDPRVVRVETTPNEIKNPAPVSDEGLAAAVHALVPAMPPRGRHLTMLALCGALAKEGWSVEAIADFASAVIGMTRKDGHPEFEKWEKAAFSSREKVLRGEEVTGWASFNDLACTGRDGTMDESRRPMVEAAVLAARRALGVGPAIDVFTTLVGAGKLRAALDLPATGVPTEALEAAAKEHGLPMELLDRAAEIVLALGAQAAGQPIAPRKYFESMREFKLRDIKPPQWLVRDLITRGGLAVISAEPKSTKSWLATDIAVGVASGTSVINTFAVDRPGVAAYFYAEDHEASVKTRINALSATRAIPGDTWLDRLHVQPRGRALDVTKDYDLTVLLASCMNLGKLDILILDPLRDVHSGEEDKSDSMSVVMKRLRGVAAALDCAVLFVHHSAKSNADNKLRRQGQKMRGSSAVHGAVDCGIYLWDLRGDGKVKFINGITSEVKGARSGGTLDLTLDLEDDADGCATRATWSTAERSEVPEEEVDNRMIEIVQKLFDHAAPMTRDTMVRKVAGGIKKIQAALEAAVSEGLAEIRLVDGRAVGWEITEAGRQLIRRGRESVEPEPAPARTDPVGGFIASLTPDRN